MNILPALAPLPAHLTQHGSDPNLLRDELLGLIRKAIEYHPLTEVALGPSEVGHPYSRRLGYTMLGYDENPGEPNWKATVGTAIHSWLEEVMTADILNQDRHLLPIPSKRGLADAHASRSARTSRRAKLRLPSRGSDRRGGTSSAR